MTKRKEFFTCATCFNEFRPTWARQKYCSLQCAIEPRIAKGAPDECWPWQGASSAKGYGQIRVNDQLLYVHRVVCELTNGRTFKKTELALHKCDNPPCCNPAHLFVGSSTDNALDMYAKRRQGNRAYMRGSRHTSARLSESDVSYIRRRIAAGAPKRPLAREMGVSQGAILDIAAGRSWAWLK